MESDKIIEMKNEKKNSKEYRDSILGLENARIIMGKGTIEKPVDYSLTCCHVVRYGQKAGTTELKTNCIMPQCKEDDCISYGKGRGWLFLWLF